MPCRVCAAVSCACGREGGIWTRRSWSGLAGAGQGRVQEVLEVRRGEVADRVRFGKGRVGEADGCFGSFAQGVRVWMRDREAGQGLWDRPGQVGAVQVRAGSARRDECCRPGMVGRNGNGPSVPPICMMRECPARQ